MASPNDVAADGLIAVRPVVPRSDLAYRQFIGASLLLAVLVGFVLGLHVTVSRLLEIGRPERTADLIQAHGQVQLLGFAGLYVIGMSLRLLPRFAGAPLQLAGLLPIVLWSMVTSLLLRGVLLPWFEGDMHHALLLTSTFGVLVAASAYLLLVSATLTFSTRHRGDASSLAFLLGAASLYAAGSIATFVVIKEGAEGPRTVPYLADNAVTQLELLGFLVVFVIGVALRALPVLVGRERPERGSSLLPVFLAASVAVHAGALLYMQYGSYSDALAMLADAALVAAGLALLAFVWQAGVLRPRANRTRPASQPALWLVRGAFAWLLTAAALMLYYGGRAFVAQELLAQADFDAVRHAVGLGLVTNLILGMSLMILPEFAGERQHANQQRLLALTLAGLINAAALMRVVPSVFGREWSADARDALMAAGGSLAELAMLAFAAYLLRLIWRTRQQGRASA